MSTKRFRDKNRRPQPSRGLRPQRGQDNRASWQRLRDHYLERARAALDSGDRVEAEGFFQHADHYFRMLQGTAA